MTASIWTLTPSRSLPRSPNAAPGSRTVTRPSSTVDRPATGWLVRSPEPARSGPGSARSTRTMPDAISHVGYRSTSTNAAKTSAGGRAIALSMSTAIVIARPRRSRSDGAGTTGRAPDSPRASHSGGSAPGQRARGRRRRAARGSPRTSGRRSARGQLVLPGGPGPIPSRTNPPPRGRSRRPRRSRPSPREPARLWRRASRCGRTDRTRRARPPSQLGRRTAAARPQDGAGADAAGADWAGAPEPAGAPDPAGAPEVDGELDKVGPNVQPPAVVEL